MKEIGVNDPTNRNSMMVFKNTDDTDEIINYLRGLYTSILENLMFKIPEYFSGYLEVGLLPYIEKGLNCEEKNKDLLKSYRYKDSASLKWKEDSRKIAVSYLNGILVFEKVYLDFMDERHDQLLRLNESCDIILINCGLKNKIYRNGFFFEKYLDGLNLEEYGIEDQEQFKLLDKFDLNLEKDLDLFLQNFDYQEDKRIFDVCTIEDLHQDHYENSYFL